jgi:hypothetical protein
VNAIQRKAQLADSTVGGVGLLSLLGNNMRGCHCQW